MISYIFAFVGGALLATMMDEEWKVIVGIIAMLFLMVAGYTTPTV